MRCPWKEGIVALKVDKTIDDNCQRRINLKMKTALQLSWSWIFSQAGNPLSDHSNWTHLASAAEVKMDKTQGSISWNLRSTIARGTQLFPAFLVIKLSSKKCFWCLTSSPEKDVKKLGTGRNSRAQFLRNRLLACPNKRQHS